MAIWNWETPTVWIQFGPLVVCLVQNCSVTFRVTYMSVMYPSLSLVWICSTRQLRNDETNWFLLTLPPILSLASSIVTWNPFSSSTPAHRRPEIPAPTIPMWTLGVISGVIILASILLSQVWLRRGSLESWKMSRKCERGLQKTRAKRLFPCNVPNTEANINRGGQAEERAPTDQPITLKGGFWSTSRYN